MWNFYYGVKKGERDDDADNWKQIFGIFLTSIHFLDY